MENLRSPKVLPSRLLRKAQVIERTGLGKSTIYERIKRNAFPVPVKLGISAVGWLENEIEEWISSQVRNTRGGSND